MSYCLLFNAFNRISDEPGPKSFHENHVVPIILKRGFESYYVRIYSGVRITVDRKTNSTDLKIKGSHWSRGSMDVTHSFT